MTQPTQPGYQEGGEPMWWWRVAHHLDSAALAAVNVMAHNVDDPAAIFALQDKFREAQAILLVIFRAKGLLPPDAPMGPAAPIVEAELVATEAPMVGPIVEAEIVTAEAPAAPPDTEMPSPPDETVETPAHQNGAAQEGAIYEAALQEAAAVAPEGEVPKA